MGLKKYCSGELCIGQDNAARAIYKDSNNEIRHRCMACIPNKDRNNLQFSSYELTIINDLIKHISEKYPDLVPVHDKTFADIRQRPDLIYEIKDGYVSFEIDEAGHKNKRYIERDDQKFDEFKKFANKNKKKFYLIRIVVGEDNDDNAIACAAGGRCTPVIKIEENYDKLMNVVFHKFDKRIQKRASGENIDLGIHNIEEKMKSMKINNLICKAICKDGNNCKYKAKDHGLCGRHAK